MFKNKGLLLVVLGAPLLVSAQQYPSRPIRIIVQFTPGTSTDVMARVVAQRLDRKSTRLNSSHT